MQGEVKHVRSLYEAAKIYYQSRGIAWFNLEAIDRVIGFLAESSGFVSSSAVNAAGVLQGLRLARTGREAGYILKFLWHVGFLSCRYSRGRFEYRLNAAGHRYYRRRLQQGSEAALSQLYYAVTSRWAPLLKALEYLRAKGRASVRDIVRDLGGEMEYWTSIMSNFGFEVQPVKKPYNEFVVRNLLIPLMQEFGLIEARGGGYELTEQARHVLEKARKDYDVVRTRPQEPLIYAAICDMLLAREAILVSPWIDEATARSIVKGVLKGVGKYTELSELRVVTRRPDDKTRRALRVLRELEDYVELEMGYLTRREVSLHAKIYLSERAATVTSANLLQRSLWRNFEVGIYLPETSTALQQVAEEVWQHAQPHRLI